MKLDIPPPDSAAAQQILIPLGFSGSDGVEKPAASREQQHDSRNVEHADVKRVAVAERRVKQHARRAA